MKSLAFIILLYFDHNATTPVMPQVSAAFAAATRDSWGNPSSTHSHGQAAREALERARRSVAKALNASTAEIVFTSGGTESNNLALLGLVRNLPGRNKHVITSAIEHPAVLGPCARLEREGVDITRVGVSRSGIVDPDEVRRHLRPQTVLISIMHVNNEVGTIQPLREIGCLAREHDVFLHSDGIQAAGKLAIDVVDLGVHLYSLSGHKFYAPKGTGALYVAKGTPVHGIQFGGRHERERRAGTENVPGAVAFARALELSCIESVNHTYRLRELFEGAITSALVDVEVNGAHAPRVSNTSSITFRGLSGEALTIALDLNGMSVSTGSACSSGSIEASHVLLAMGRSQAEAKSSLRFSFGRDNTLTDLEQLIDVLTATVRKLHRSPTGQSRNREVGVV